MMTAKKDSENAGDRRQKQPGAAEKTRAAPKKSAKRTAKDRAKSTDKGTSRPTAKVAGRKVTKAPARRTAKTAAKKSTGSIAKKKAASGRYVAIGHSARHPQATVTETDRRSDVPRLDLRAAAAPGELIAVKAPRIDDIQGLELAIRDVENLTIAGPDHVEFTVGRDALDLIRRVVAVVKSGAAGMLLIGEQTDAELSSQEAADLLNVSRPHVVKLAREGKLPYRMVGNRHRFRLSDVEEYDESRRLKREAALASIVPEDGYRAGDF